KLTAFLELESAIRLYRRNPRNLRSNDFFVSLKTSIDTRPGAAARSVRAKLFRRLARESSHLTLFPQGKPRANGSLAQPKQEYENYTHEDNWPVAFATRFSPHLTGVRLLCAFAGSASGCSATRRRLSKPKHSGGGGCALQPHNRRRQHGQRF